MVENFKKRLFIAGRKASDILRECSKDLVRLSLIQSNYTINKSNIFSSNSANPMRPCSQRNTTFCLLKTLRPLSSSAGPVTHQSSFSPPATKRGPTASFSVEIIFPYFSLNFTPTVRLGRLFDGSLLDMVEFGVTSCQGLEKFTTSIPTNTKPCLLFCGEMWEDVPELQKVQSLLIDTFRGEVIDAVRLQGLEHTIMFTATKDYIFIRSYK